MNSPCADSATMGSNYCLVSRASTVDLKTQVYCHQPTATISTRLKPASA